MFYETQSISMEELRWLWDIGAIKVLPPTYDPKRSKTIFPPTLIPDLQNGSLPLRVMRACSRRYEDILVSMSNIGEAGPPPKLSDSFYDKGNVEQNWTKALHIAYTALGVRIPLSDKALISAGDCGVMLRCVREMYVAGRALEAKYMPDVIVNAPPPLIANTLGGGINNGVIFGPPKLATMALAERRRLAALPPPSSANKQHLLEMKSQGSTNFRSVEKLKCRRQTTTVGGPLPSLSSSRWTPESLDVLYKDIVRQVTNMSLALTHAKRRSKQSNDGDSGDELDDYTIEDVGCVIILQALGRGYCVRQIPVIKAMRWRHLMERQRRERFENENYEMLKRLEFYDVEQDGFDDLISYHLQQRCRRRTICVRSVMIVIKWKLATLETYRRKVIGVMQCHWSWTLLAVKVRERAMRRLVRCQSWHRRCTVLSQRRELESRLDQRLIFVERVKSLLRLCRIHGIMIRMMLRCKRLMRVHKLFARVREALLIYRGLLRVKRIRLDFGVCLFNSILRARISAHCVQKIVAINTTTLMQQCLREKLSARATERQHRRLIIDGVMRYQHTCRLMNVQRVDVAKRMILLAAYNIVGFVHARPSITALQEKQLAYTRRMRILGMVEWQLSQRKRREVKTAVSYRRAKLACEMVPAYVAAYLSRQHAKSLWSERLVTVCSQLLAAKRSSWVVHNRPNVLTVVSVCNSIYSCHYVNTVRRQLALTRLQFMHTDDNVKKYILIQSVSRRWLALRRRKERALRVWLYLLVNNIVENDTHGKDIRRVLHGQAVMRGKRARMYVRKMKQENATKLVNPILRAIVSSLKVQNKNMKITELLKYVLCDESVLRRVVLCQTACRRYLARRNMKIRQHRVLEALLNAEKPKEPVMWAF